MKFRNLVLMGFAAMGIAACSNSDENGIDAVLIDGKPREIHARVIWAALDSPFVQPHLRHICTERKTK